MAYGSLTCSNNYGHNYKPTTIPQIKVTLDNSYVGLIVYPGLDWIYENQNDQKTGTIIQIGGEYDGYVLHPKQCVVQWEKAIEIYRIGANGLHDLYVSLEHNEESKKNKLITKIDNYGEKTIKVQRLNPTIRKGKGTGGSSIRCGSSRKQRPKFSN